METLFPFEIKFKVFLLFKINVEISVLSYGSGVIVTTLAVWRGRPRGPRTEGILVRQDTVP